MMTYPHLIGIGGSEAMPRPVASKRLSAVVPCYNEEEGLTELVRRLAAACSASVGDDFEIVLVNDGSSDRTWSKIIELARCYPQIVGVNLARNHGHQLALSAGFYVTRGECILSIDADLQDPPELLREMMAALDAGGDVAYGLRIDRESDTWFKRASAAVFYRVLQRLTDVPIPVDSGDFRLMKRKVLDVLLSMPEQHRFIRGMVAWIGFRQIPLPYRRGARFAGTTKYPLRKMVRFAMDAITAFSVTPLRLSLYFCLGSVIAAFLLGIFAIGIKLTGEAPPGWTSITILLLAFSALQMLCLGIMGEYIGRIYTQSKQRPLFIIESIHQSEVGSNAMSGEV